MNKQQSKFGVLPATGLVRKSVILGVLGISSATLGRWIRSEQFPQPDHRPSQRLPMWRVETVRRWLTNRGAEQDAGNVGRWFEAGAHDASLDIGFGLDAVRQWTAAFGWPNAVYWAGDEAVIFSEASIPGKRSPEVRFDAQRPNEVVFVDEAGEETICPDPIALMIELGGVSKRCGVGRIPEPAKLAPLIADWLLYGSVSPRLLAQVKAEVGAARRQ